MTLQQLLIGTLFLLAVDFGLDGYLDAQNALEQQHYQLINNQGE